MPSVFLDFDVREDAVFLNGKDLGLTDTEFVIFDVMAHQAPNPMRINDIAEAIKGKVGDVRLPAIGAYLQYIKAKVAHATGKLDGFQIIERVPGGVRLNATNRKAHHFTDDPYDDLEKCTA